MCAVDLVSDKDTKELLNDLPGATKLLNQKLSDSGLYTRATRQVFFAPPLTVTESDIDDMVGIFDRALTETERELGLA